MSNFRVWILAIHLQVRNLILTGFLFCGPLFLTFCFLNTVAIAYNSTAALPFGTIVVILLIWTLVTIPLLVLGGVAGKNNKSEFQAPCRTTKFPREIPQLPWYRGTIPQMAMAGFLPFSAIYIELYYIFASVWGHKVYTIYSILFIVFIILITVTAFITIALTYFQLAVEDHQWWWRESGLSSLYRRLSLFFYSDHALQWCASMFDYADQFCVEVQQVLLCWAIAFTIILLARTWQDSCKLPFISVTWHVYAMVFSSC